MPGSVAINLSWLLRLRWLSLLGQLLAIASAVGVLGLTFPLPPLVALLAVGAASNAVAARWLAATPEGRQEVIGGLMALDVVLLTGVFLCTGGAFNPFTSLYVVNIALAAVVLRPAWTWSLLGLSMACFALLFTIAIGQPTGDDSVAHVHGPGGSPDQLRHHLEGMWLSLALAAGLIVYFVQRVKLALSAREQELEEARSATLRSQRLASLATLAAGAAHELATPLSTIAIVARELELSLASPRKGHGESAVPKDDVRLIREQVERCREILDQMAADSGQISGEDWSPVTPTDLIADALNHLAARTRVNTQLLPASDPAAISPLRLPRRAVARAIRNLIKNALQATPETDSVDVTMTTTATGLEIEVRDRGAGMSAATLARAGEPFFTTKTAGRGMGLGLFLTRTVCDQLGGSFTLESSLGAGTVARVRLPTQPPATIGRIDGLGSPMPPRGVSWNPAAAS